MGTDAKGPILTAAVVTWGAAVANAWNKRKTQNAMSGYVTVTVGVFILLIFLFLFAEINPRLAIAFAWLIALGSLVVNGVPLFSALTKIQSGSKSIPLGTKPAPWQWPDILGYLTNGWLAHPNPNQNPSGGHGAPVSSK